MVVHAIATCQLKIIWNLLQEHLENNFNFSSAEKRALSPSEHSGGGGGGGGGHSGFQVVGMIKGFFWKFSIPGFV